MYKYELHLHTMETSRCGHVRAADQVRTYHRLGYQGLCVTDHLHNGYVAEYKNASDFANGICWCLGDDEHNGLSEMAYRKAAALYSESNVAMQYINLYNKITGKHA